MYCPNCSQQSSESMRFCSRCGFQLGRMQELLAAEAASGTPGLEVGSGPGSLRQIDINIGAGLTLVGAIMSLLVAAMLHAPQHEKVTMGLFILSCGFGVFVLLSQLSPRHRGLTVGAALMFIGALAAILMGAVFEEVGIFMVAAILFPLIFFWTRFARLFLKLLFEKDQILIPEVQPGSFKAFNPPAFDRVVPPVHAFVQPRRVSTADMAEPPSVTEKTTALIDDH